MTDADSLIKKLENREGNGRLAELYFADEKQLEYQNERYIEAVRCFRENFGTQDVALYSAPGRTEVGGNHTDHQRGMVLAASVNLDVIAVAGHGSENKVEVISEGYDKITIDLSDLALVDEEKETTKALIKGVIAGIKEYGYQVGPFRAYVTSEVLIGAGLSSSAAFETIIGTILSGMFNEMQISPVDIARIGQFAENVYFGKPCGLMDQTACSVGGFVHIDFEDPENPVVNKVDFNMEDCGYQLCIVDTMGSHAELTPDYAAIPSEMKAVAQFFGKEVLREVEEAEFYAHIPEIREELGDRAVLRAFHFFHENKRVQKEADALRSGDFKGFLETFKKSAASSYKYLQNVYSNQNVQKQAVPVTLAFTEMFLGEHGVCRIHGGGFAGTIQVFVEKEFVAEYKEQIEKILGEGSCHVLKIRSYGGVKVF